VLELLFLKFFLLKKNTIGKNSSSSSYIFISPTFSPSFLKKEYQLQNVIVTSKDFEKKFSLYYPDTSAARNNIKNWQHIASILTEEAVILNEAIKKGIVSPNEKFLDPKKIDLGRQYFEKEGTSYISGEVISVWFYNTQPPPMGVEAAKAKTQALIEKLREKVAKEEISMKQAGEIIASSSQLEEIDFAYKTNAYFTFEFIKPNQKVFNDPDLNKILWQFKEGEVSPVLIGKDFAPSGWYEAYFVVIKISSKKIQEFDDINKLIEKRKQEGLKIIL
jgi:hypothetical protein